jgi:hypothetical protein
LQTGTLRASASWIPASWTSALPLTFVLMDQAQHAPGKTLLESVELGNLPGVGMTIIDGIVRSTRSRNTPPAARLPEVL